MANIAGARIFCGFYSKTCRGITVSCSRHHEVSNILRRYVSSGARQMPRREAAFKFTGMSEGGYLLLLFPIATACLGTWQLGRRRWKLDILDKIEKGLSAPPIPLPTDLDELKDLEYTRVVVRGTFDYSHEAVIGPRSNLNEAAPLSFKAQKEKAPGVHIITPFKLADRDLTILVNRGWLSSSQFMDLKYRKNGQVEDEIEMVGVVRHSDKRHKTIVAMGFTITCPGDEKGFLQRDIPAIAEALGTAPVFVDATELRLKPGAPLGGQTRINLPNNHGTYVFTWYALAIITLWMWLDRFRRPVAPKNIMALMEQKKMPWK